MAQTNAAPPALAAEQNSASIPARSFDVVSIRPSKEPDDSYYGVYPDEYRAVGLPLIQTVMAAYFSQAFMSRDRIVGAPDWIWNERYDFVGKITSADVPEWLRQRDHSNSMVENKMLEAMLQSALADRCKLVAHLTPGQVRGYALVVGKHGPNWKRLKVAPPDEKIPPSAMRMPEGGKLIPYLQGAAPTVTFLQTSMASLAAHLPVMLVAPVEDRTGLKDKYDFTLTRMDIDGQPSDVWDIEALGLKLEPVKLSTMTLVIDHIERPSPN